MHCTIREGAQNFESRRSLPISRESPKWDRVESLKRVSKLDGDGHAAKLVRAIANGEAACKQYEEDPDNVNSFPIMGEMWLLAGHMAIDSTEGAETRWVRNTSGFADRARL